VRGERIFFGCSTSKIGLVFRLGATVNFDQRFQSVFCPASYGGSRRKWV